MAKLKLKHFTVGIDSLTELATISFMIKKGLGFDVIGKLFENNMFPELQTPQAQNALVQLIERRGLHNLVSEVLSENTESENDENFVASVGFKAFMKMVSTKAVDIEEIVLSISPEDFLVDNWKQ